ncbi:MAG: hypothetical protein JXR41_09835 [Bacteroidales bacterium]|nr:hypothetical protein [Bacteroidales bacterium]
MRTKNFKWLCIVAFLYPICLPAQNIPLKVDIKAEKQVLRPGETTKIILNNFRTKNNRPYVTDTAVFVGDRIIVSCSAGEILDGTEWNNYDPEKRTLTLLQNEDSKIFFLGMNDNIEFYYRAPLRATDPEVEISAYCSLTNGSVELHPLEKSEDGYILNKSILKILLNTYLLLQYKEEKQEYLGSKTVYRHDINAVVRIDCEPSAIPNSLSVKELKVLEIQGIAERESSDEHLVARATTAEPSAYNRLVMLSLNPTNGSVEGIMYTQVPLRTEWRGDDIPEGPPDVIKGGPVAEDERGSLGARYEGSILADEFGNFPDRGKMSTEERQRLREKQAKLLFNFTETQVHPDFSVKGGNNKTFYSGNGEWADKNKSGRNYYKKTFKWELYLQE